MLDIVVHMWHYISVERNDFHVGFLIKRKGDNYMMDILKLIKENGYKLIKERKFQDEPFSRYELISPDGKRRSVPLTDGPIYIATGAKNTEEAEKNIKKGIGFKFKKKGDIKWKSVLTISINQ